MKVRKYVNLVYSLLKGIFLFWLSNLIALFFSSFIDIHFSKTAYLSSIRKPSFSLDFFSTNMLESIIHQDETSVSVKVNLNMVLVYSQMISMNGLRKELQ